MATLELFLVLQAYGSVGVALGGDRELFGVDWHSHKPITSLIIRKINELVIDSLIIFSKLLLLHATFALSRTAPQRTSSQIKLFLHLIEHFYLSQNLQGLAKWDWLLVLG